MINSAIDRTYALATELGLLRPRDLDDWGIPRSNIGRLMARGQLVRLGRGVYAPALVASDESLTFAQACKRIPTGAICLLSALRYHNIGTQNPAQVWMAIHRKASLPRIDYPPLRIVRFSGPALLQGIEEHSSPSGPIRVYNVPKTVADCFRYRNKIGLDVALEALQACWAERRATMDELWRWAKLDRISTVIRPYLEALR